MPRSTPTGLWLLLSLSTCLLFACDGPEARRNATPALGASARQRAPSRAPEATPAAPDAAPIDGPTLISQLKQPGRRGALVNVWASWCGSCKRELPMLLGLREAFAPQGLAVLFVSADTAEKWPDAVSFARQAGLPLPVSVVAGALGPFKRALSPAWRGAIPASFLFDGDGQLRHRWEGPVYEHELAPILQGYLAGDDIDGETLPPVSAGRTTD